MAYSYFTKQLLAKSSEIDLANIFPDKQERAKERLNTNYSLPQIVDWIKESTNNFKKSEGYFIDLDQAIRRLVFKYYDSTGQKNPFSKIDVEGTIASAQPRVPSEVTVEGVKNAKPDISETKAVQEVENNAIAQVEEAVSSMRDLVSIFPDDPTYQDALKSLEDYLEVMKMTQ